MTTARFVPFDPLALASTHRQFTDMVGFVSALARTVTAMSWGAHRWQAITPYCLRFTVRGRLHTGHVFVAINARDLVQCWLTTNRLRVVKELNDVFIDDLLSVLDSEIETIARPCH